MFLFVNETSEYQAFFYILVTIFALLSLIVSIFGLFVAIRSKNKTLQLQKELKSVDLIVSLQKRFEEVNTNLFELTQNNADENLLERAYFRFWGLQFEQWQYFNLGYIDYTIFDYWKSKRIKEYNSVSDKKKFKEYLKSALDEINNKEFSSFAKALFIEEAEKTETQK